MWGSISRLAMNTAPMTKAAIAATRPASDMRAERRPLASKNTGLSVIQYTPALTWAQISARFISISARVAANLWRTSVTSSKSSNLLHRFSAAFLNTFQLCVKGKTPRC